MKSGWVARTRKSKIVIPQASEIRKLLFPADRKPIPGQVSFLDIFDERSAKFIAYRGGIGAGKTWIGSHYALECAARNPKVRGFIGSNTYPQLWQSTLTGLYEVADAYGVPIYPKTPEAAAKKKVIYLWEQVEVLCRSAEKNGYKLWDGFKVGWFWLDEAKDMVQDASRTIRERLRDNRADVLQGWYSSSPTDGWFGYLEDNDPEVAVVTADSRENHFLPDGYINSALSTMSPEMAAQQIEGKVLSVSSGRCYSNFTRADNTGSYERGTGELMIGIDFNVSPGMHAYLIEFRGDDVFVLDEIYLRGGDTPGLAAELVKRYGNTIPLVPDAAGGAKHTTGTSDHAILKEAGFSLKNRPANPPIKDRINSVNGRILNALGERHLFVDKKCGLLINELQQCTWEVMAKESYKGPLTHPGAAIGYAIHLRFPFRSGGWGMAMPKG